MDKVKITYDTIFEILMREKSAEELQKLDHEFLQDVIGYVAEKRKTIDEPAIDTYALEEKERAAKQLQNITRMLHELYERREKKILNIAVIRSRTGADIVDTSPLLSEEKMLFDAVVAQLDYYRSNILFRMLNVQFSAAKEPPKVPQTTGPTKLLRFLYPVPKFVGKELEIYGPFIEEDVASLPIDIAAILIEKGRAEEIV